MLLEEMVKIANETFERENLTAEDFRVFMRKGLLPRANRIGLGSHKGVVADYSPQHLADWLAYIKTREDFRVTFKDIERIRGLVMDCGKGKKVSTKKWKEETEAYLNERNAVLLYLEGL